MSVIPSDIAKELLELTQTNRKGVEALFDAETHLAQTEYDLDKIEAQAFLDATGSVAERQARAKLLAADARVTVATTIDVTTTSSHKSTITLSTQRTIHAASSSHCE